MVHPMPQPGREVKGSTEDDLPGGDKLTLTEAVKSLTGHEVLAIQRRFGAALEALSGTEVLLGVVHQVENRTRPSNDQVSWNNVLNRKIGDLEQLFAPEQDEEEDSKSGLGYR